MTRDWRYMICRLLAIGLGGVLVWAGWLKVRDPVGFADDIYAYGWLNVPLTRLMAVTLPWAEIVTGLALVTGGRWLAPGLLFATGLTGLFFAAQLVAFVQGKEINCGCFAGEEPIGWYSVSRTATLFVLSFGLSIAHSRLGGRPVRKSSEVRPKLEESYA